MKKIFPLLLVLMIIVFGILIFKDHITSHVIILKDGSRIVADESWVVGDKVFYEIKGITDFVAIEQVQDIKQAGLKKGSGIATFIQEQLNLGKTTANDILSQSGSGATGRKSLMLRGGPVLVGILLCIVFAVLLLRKRRSHKTEKTEKKTSPATVDLSAADEEHKDQEIVVEHFLKVFMAQKGAEENAEAVFKRMGLAHRTEVSSMN